MVYCSIYSMLPEGRHPKDAVSKRGSSFRSAYTYSIRLFGLVNVFYTDLGLSTFPSPVIDTTHTVPSSMHTLIYTCRLQFSHMSMSDRRSPSHHLVEPVDLPSPKLLAPEFHDGIPFILRARHAHPAHFDVYDSRKALSESRKSVPRKEWLCRLWPVKHEDWRWAEDRECRV